jgi:SsrA-binding protein
MGISIATNKKALRDFHILESVECGIELKGGEVKSLRDKKASLDESYARFEGTELFLYDAYIQPYAQASYLKTEPTRTRKILLHKHQIEKLHQKVSQKGLTLFPLKLYFNDRGFAKVEVALAKGKKQHDRRDDIKRRETDLALRRAVKNRR